MNLLKEITKGILRENPVLVLLIGLCPTLAVTATISDAVGMSIAAAFVLILSNLIISLIKGIIPGKIRIPCYIVVIATFVTLVQMFMAAYFPDLNESIGIFIPLIVVNCIILGRAEAFAGRNGALASAADGVGMALGFAAALLAISLVREVLGSWSIAGVPITESGFQPMAVMVMAPGAFIVLALILGLMNAAMKSKRPVTENAAALKEMALFLAAKPEANKLAKEQAQEKDGS